MRSVAKYPGSTMFESGLNSSSADAPGSPNPSSMVSNPPGRTLASVASWTPGSSRTRSSRVRQKPSAAAWSYLTIDRSSVVSSIPRGSYPGSTAPARAIARAKSPAPTTSVTLSATCATRNACLSLDRLENPCASTFSAPAGCAADVCNAGASPEASAARSDIPVVKAITRLSSVSDSTIGNGSADSQLRSSEVTPRARTNPAAPPIAKSSVVSVRSCRTSRPRPAPSDNRTAISRRLAAPRASRMPETLAHATRSTKDTIPINSATNTATDPAVARHQR